MLTEKRIHTLYIIDPDASPSFSLPSLATFLSNHWTRCEQAIAAIWGLPTVGTESWNRKIAQKTHTPLGKF